MGEKWSKERIWAWYEARPWMRGCNFMSSDCANRIDQWQEEGFEERLRTADEELKLAAQTGFNTIRIIPEFAVWDQQHDGFMERFERYVATAWKHGISCMVVFGNDCMRPREVSTPVVLGPQSYDWGYHGGRKVSQHGGLPGMGYHPQLDEPQIAPRFFAWVREMIETYRSDERICVWDLYNEPGNSRRDPVTPDNLRKIFAAAREVDPIQPLTACVWRCPANRETPLPAVEQLACELSDIISYHSYGTYELNIQIIKRLKDCGRPILNTEWLGRVLHNTVQEMFPLFYLEKIGCWNWGFVAGKYQTYEPWEATWKRYEADPALDYDFTKWFHDLYRPNHRPYDPKEIEIIKRFSALADADFARKA